MSETGGTVAPKECLYCDGTDPDCGFCEMGKPLDTQEDWDRRWGRVPPCPHGSMYEPPQSGPS